MATPPQDSPTWLEKLVLVWIDPRKTGRISLVFSILIDFIFIIVKTSDGIYHHKAWPIAVGIYYLALFLIRILLFKSLGKKTSRDTENRTVRRVAVFLLALNFLLSIMIVQMTTSRVVIKYNAFMAMLDGLYLGYRIAISLFNAITYSRRGRNLLFTSIKYLNLVATMVAILMTQTTILMSLGEHDLNLMQILNGISGFIVAATILGLSVRLLRRSHAQNISPNEYFS